MFSKFVRHLPLLLIIIGGSWTLTACKKTEPQSVGRATEKKNLYQCPMHPQIIKDQPGSCPICGMDLVPVEQDGEHAEHDSSPDPTGSVTPGASPVVRIDPAVVQNIGVRTEPVRRGSLSAEIRLDGKVAADEARIKSVTARVMGYVEKLQASATGLSVRQGQTLLELYSPDLVSAQEELLQAIGIGGSGEALVQSARRRLLNWGVSEAFIQTLEKKRQSARRVPIQAPLTGVVFRKSVLEGQNVMPGMELFQIVDLSRVWVTARVYQADLAVARVGASVLLNFRNVPGRDFTAKISFVSPEMDPATRTVEIRIEIPNTPARDFKPEMFAELRVRGTGTDSTLVVPEQALIRTGNRDVAVVALGDGRFQPREVRVGRSAGGFVEILEGLIESESLVTSAQFLIDSESNLRAAVEQLRGGSHEH